MPNWQIKAKLKIFNLQTHTSMEIIIIILLILI